MKIGYGKNRRMEDLLAVGAERAYVDEGRSRSMRARLFDPGPFQLRGGDTLILLARGDLGRGREVERFLAMAEGLGVTVEVHELPGPPRKLPGPKPAFTPSDDERAWMQDLWRSAQSRAVVMRAIKDQTGWAPTRNQMYKMFGPRGRFTRK